MTRPCRRTKVLTVLRAALLLSLTISMAIYWEGIVRAFPVIRTLPVQARNPGISVPNSYSPIVPPKPTVSTLFQEFPLIDPSYQNLPAQITFKTSFGKYVFDKTQPFMSYAYRDGTVLVSYSAFHVMSRLPAPILFRNYTLDMSSLSNTHIDYSVSLMSQNRTVGVLTVSVNFDRVQKPKITVRLQPSQVLAQAGFNVVWVVRGPSTTVRLEKLSESLDFGNVTSLGSYNLRETRIDMGPGGSPDTWRVWAQVDWTDAPAGSFLDFGNVFTLPFIRGPAAVIFFPANKTSIDPTVVGQTTLSGTALSTQRHVFFDGSNFWAFYHNGTQTVYEYSSDGLTWNNPPRVLWSYQNTAVWFTSGYVYALAGTTGSGLTSVTVRLYFVKGAISGSMISWGSTVTVDSFTYADSGAFNVRAAYAGVNMAVGSDGLITVAFSKIALSTYRVGCNSVVGSLGPSEAFSPLLICAEFDSSRYLSVKRSSDASGTTWNAATTLLSNTGTGDGSAYGNPYVSILSPLSSGAILGIYDDKGTIRYSKSSAWTSITTLDTEGVGADPLQFGSAVSDSGFNVRFVYLGSDNSVKYRYYNGTSWSTAQTIATGTSSSPQISLGAGGDLHVLYLASNIIYYSHYSASGGWGLPNTPFGYTSFNSPAFLTATANATNGFLVAEWTEGNSLIKLGSLPILTGWSPYAIPSDPWDEEGLVPNSQYYQNYQEYVSPFTGLLTILQPDFTLPGRGFDDAGTLAFTQVYRAPYSFRGSSPFNYEGYPYSNLGYGWGLNWPWLGTNYLHLTNGQGYRIVWTNGVFENHKGEDFKLTQNLNGTYTLYDKPGTIYLFDSSKRLSYILDRTRNNKVTFTYSSNGISVITDTAGRTINFAYSSGYLSTVTVGGRRWTFSYSNGDLASVTDPQGRVTSYQYSPNSYLVSQITYTDGGYTTYSYGSQTNTHRIYQVTTKFSNGTVLRQGVFNYTVGYFGSTDYVTSAMVKVSNATATQGYYSYAFQPSNMTRITENAQGQPMSKIIDVFDGVGHISQETIYPGGGTASYTNYFNYDNWGNTVYSRLATTATTYREIFYSYVNTNTQNQYVEYSGNNVSGFSNSFYSSTVDPSIHNLLVGRAEYQNGAGSNRIESYYQYDFAGDSLQEQDLLGSSQWLTTSFSYDTYGNVLTRTDANGNQTTYQYSPAYQYAYRTQASNIVKGVTLATQFGYNFTTGDVLNVTSPSGNVTAYRYDEIGRVTSITYPSIGGVRAQRKAVYNDVNNTDTVYDENNNYRKYYYDGVGRLTKIAFYSGGSVYSTQTYTYYWNDKARTVTDPTGNITAYTYDFLGRTLKLIHPDGTFRQWVYDDVNSKVTLYDEKYHPTVYQYDWLNRLLTVTEYVSGQPYNTSYVYDHVGNLIQATDELGQVTNYNYDSTNRLTRTVFPDTTNETRTYDNVGSLISRVTQNNTLIQYTYDQINRLTKVTYPDGSTVSYVYDKDSNRLQMVDPSSTTTYTYDPRNRLLTETRTIGGQDYPLTYKYDSASNLIQLTYPDGYRLNYTYDALNRITNAGTVATFTYRKDNRVSTITYGNGVRTTYSYDKNGRTTRILTQNGTSTLLNLNYAYDPNSNPLSESTNGETYGYDDLNRLTSANGPWGTIGYTYDAAGNRLSQTVNGTATTTYTYGSYNMLLTAGSTSYSYDNNGNTISKTTGSSVWNYTYDYENRLRQVALNMQPVFQALYDGDGRRVETTAGDTTIYDYQAGSWDPAYVKDLTTGLTSDVVFADVLRVGKVQAGVSSFYHLDRLGSVRLETQAASPPTFSAKYLPYGNTYATSGAEAFQYTGKQLDVATGLSYFGYRYYDSQSGRFISVDLAQADYLNPQSLNRYTYALNNPNLYTDPTGADIGQALGWGLLAAGLVIADIVLGTYLGPEAAMFAWEGGGAQAFDYAASNAVDAALSPSQQYPSQSNTQITTISTHASTTVISTSTTSQTSTMTTTWFKVTIRNGACLSSSTTTTVDLLTGNVTTTTVTETTLYDAAGNMLGVRTEMTNTTTMNQNLRNGEHRAHVTDPGEGVEYVA